MSGEPSGVSLVAAGVSGVSGAGSLTVVVQPLSSASSKSASEGEPSGVYDVAADVSGVSGAGSRPTVGRFLSSASS